MRKWESIIAKLLLWYGEPDGMRQHEVEVGEGVEDEEGQEEEGIHQQFGVPLDDFEM